MIYSMAPDPPGDESEDERRYRKREELRAQLEFAKHPRPADPAGARYQAGQAQLRMADLYDAIATCEARMEKIGLSAHALGRNRAAASLALSATLAALLLPFLLGYPLVSSLAVFPALAYALLLHERPKLREAAIDRKYELQSLQRKVTGHWEELNAMNLNRTGGLT